MIWLVLLLAVNMSVKDAILKRKSLPVPVNPTSRIEGLKRFPSQDPRLQQALKMLEQKGEWPYNVGWTRQTEIASKPPGAALDALAWRERGSDVVGLNQEDPAIQQSLKDPKLGTLLESIMLHENRHVEGDDELGALNSQARYVEGAKSPLGDHLAKILGQQIMLRSNNAKLTKP